MKKARCFKKNSGVPTKFRGEYRKMVKTINARAAASISKKPFGFIPVSCMRRKRNTICPRSCSRFLPGRWNGLPSALDGSFSSWRWSKMSTIISSLRIRILMRGAIRKCVDSAWMKSKERMEESTLKMHCWAKGACENVKIDSKSRLSESKTRRALHELYCHP